VSAGLVGAACSSDAEVSVPSVELSTTTVTTLPPTTEAPSTTEAPTTTVDPRIAEVEAAVERFHEVQLSILLDPEASLDELAAATAEPLRSEIIGNIQMARAEGRTFVGEFSYQPLSTTFESDATALHLGCLFDRVSVFDSEGSTVVPADENPLVVSYEVGAENGRWLPSTFDLAQREDPQCELG